ncbi:MAG: NFACT RNA binding domain-containing protein [Clostridia bacterium]
MPNDYITLNALGGELNSILYNAKIDKIFMPEKDEIMLSVRAQGVTRLLVISCNASNPRIHFTCQKKENPMSAQSFCMHLRKHLQGGIINCVQMLGQDRIFGIQISSHNEMRDIVNYTLIAEMMGRYSNILVTNANGVITDTLKQVPFDMVTKRCLMPSAKYELPEQTKILPTEKEKIVALLTAFDGNKLANYVVSNIAGLCLPTVEQILQECNIPFDIDKLSLEQAENIFSKLAELLNIWGSPSFAPCVGINRNGQKDFFVRPYFAIADTKSCPTLADAIEMCVEEKDTIHRQEEHTKTLTKTYNALKTRLAKKLEKCNSRLADTFNMETYRKYGELIIANLYKLSKGDKTAVVNDYYQENSPAVTIPLNIQLSPQQNAQSYFKKYNKLKRAEEITTQQIAELETLQEYVASIEPSLKFCSTTQEIAELQQELSVLESSNQNKKQNKKKQKPAQPFTFEYKEFVICVGKNNLQNDKLTFKLANGNDLWAHTKSIHSSHVIVFAENREIPDEVIQVACEICAHFSQANTQRVECDYTQRKNVKRHPSGKLGMVLYTVYKTAFVTPNAHQELLEKN